MLEQYNSYFEAYTYGSKCEEKITAATFYPKNSGAVLLRDGGSVFNAELESILLVQMKFLALTKTY